MALIETRGISKTYGKGKNAVHALKSMDFAVEKGEFIAITGASGSGKSTLLHLLGGLDTPSSGEVLVEGQNIYQLDQSKLAVFRRRNFGFVFQFFNLVPILTAEENIRLPVLMDGKKPDEAYIGGIVSMLGIQDKLKTLPGKLSGGQQQRVAIARALAAKPRVVFADEPTGSLDSKTGHEILELMRQTAREIGQTIIIVTHDSLVASVCRRVVEISDGNIVGDYKNGEHDET